MRSCLRVDDVSGGETCHHITRTRQRVPHGPNGDGTMKTIRILLADDHTICRAGIRSLLQNLEAIEVVAEASNGREALALTAIHHPHVILMDVMMPELNGLEATARITKQFTDVS